MKILVITDNYYLLTGFRSIISAAPKKYNGFNFDYACTNNELINDASVLQMNVKTEYSEKIVCIYDLVISMHCKQLFPVELLTQVRCINIHPGYNPYNRGWFPQVFSIINKLPAGVTIHEIDEQIDHGSIIIQQSVPIYSHDTSLEVYNRILDVELSLLRENLYKIITGNYEAKKMVEEGNLNLLKNYRELCEINLEQTVSFRQAIDLLRALTHPPYNNGYFIDDVTGKKVYLSLSLYTEE